MSDRDTIERAIRHIDSCLDVDPWARDIAIDAMKAQLSEEGTTSDCISRQAAIDAILDLTDFVSVIELFEYVEEYDLQDKRSGGIIDAIDAVLLLPSVQPEVLACGEGELTVQSERKTGHWEFQGDQMFACTCCSYIASQKQLESWRTNETDSAFPLFCPNCGADMRG